MKTTNTNIKTVSNTDIENTSELMRELEKCIGMTKTYRDMIKNLEEVKKMYENQVKKLLAMLNLDGVTTEFYNAVLQNKSRTTVDSEKLKALYPEIYNALTRITEYQTLNITSLNKID